MFKYGKTNQYGQTVREISGHLRYEGTDLITGEPIHSDKPLPSIEFTGTVKLHGTNAAVTWNPTTGLRCQSRNKIVERGHQGFVEMVEQEREAIMEMVNQALKDYGIKDMEESHLTIYGEWAGPGLLGGTAISGIPKKTWFIFAIKFNKTGGDKNEGIWLRGVENLKCSSNRVRNIHEFKTWRKVIDLNNHGLSQNYLIEETLKVEESCPVAKELGVEGVGEGIIWECWINGFRHNFKVKGTKHSSSKTKQLAPVDPVKLKSISDFVQYSVTPNRVKQAMHEVVQVMNEENTFVMRVQDLTQKHTGDILRWIAHDIIKEEAESLKTSELEWKEVAKEASKTCREIFFNYLQNF